MPPSPLPRIGLTSFHALALFFFFLPWVEISCVKTKDAAADLRDAVEIRQSGLQMTYGGVTKVEVNGDRVTDTEIVRPEYAARLMIPYAVLLLIGAFAGAIPARRWRAAVALAGGGGAIVIMILQLRWGFPIIAAAGKTGLWGDANATVTQWFLMGCACHIAAVGFAVADGLGLPMGPSPPNPSPAAVQTAAS
jgi:hypothetical protein